MSLKVIELNDNALRVSDASGILVDSPGFALADGKKLSLGDSAKQQARIHPTKSHNKYWHELSLDPISHTSNVRHSADIAYAHLLYLAQEGDIDDAVIFAVPGNFTKQQLAILLGLAKQCPFKTVGMIDTAVAAASAMTHQGPIIYAEIQLHQVVLTKVVNAKGKLSRESVIQLPGVGSQNFMDLMMQLATDLFIQQCRFNPQHHADSEQQLYNALPGWLLQDDRNQNSLLLELQASTSVHTAKMPRESLISSLSGHYKRIAQQLAELASNGDSKIALSHELSELPGFIAALDATIGLEVLAVNAVGAAILRNRDYIVQTSEQISLLTSLPIAAESAVTTAISAKQKRTLATHVLIGSTAIPLGAVSLSASFGRIEKQGNGVFLDSGEQEFLLNQHKVAGKHELNLGDLIQSGDGSETIQLIQVSNG
jgi:hypothetical protein